MPKVLKKAIEKEMINVTDFRNDYDVSKTNSKESKRPGGNQIE